MYARLIFMPVLTLICMLVIFSTTWGKESTEELAKEAQNPVAKLTSMPFQNYINFDFGSQ